MDKIEVKVLDTLTVRMAERMAVTAATLTQNGPEIQSMEDFIRIYKSDYNDNKLARICRYPHPTLRKFGIVTVVVVGASRAFLEHITRHQVDVKFMSASLHYSDYSGKADFMVPLSIKGTLKEAEYISVCDNNLFKYNDAIKNGLDPVLAGNLMPRAMRNTLIISANPYQWVHMCQQRCCHRNTEETRYVMTLIASELYKLSPYLFWDIMPKCSRGGHGCPEEKMTCGHRIMSAFPDVTLGEEYGVFKN